MEDSVFGPVISSYTRAQALADGVLVDVTEWASAASFRGGFRIPVAVTASVWSDISNIPKTVSYQDVRGRATDLLWMASLAARANKGGSMCFVPVKMNIVGTRKVKQVYKMVIGPGDSGEPVVTIMQRDED